MSCRYPRLFEPIVLGKILYKNRIFYSPTGYKEQPVDEAASYYERKAIGGAASVCVGDAAVSADGISRQTQLRLDLQSTVPALEQISSAIARHGAVPAIEILHSGYYAHYSAELGGKLYGPVRTVSDAGVEIFEMTEEMILKSIEDYANAAARAQAGGFQRIVLHAGHGWQLSQFLSPMNTRADMWGGKSIENRARFAVAVCDRIRQKCPGMTLEVRISGSECYEGGYGISEGVEIAKQLDGHCDLIHVSAGNHEVPLALTIMTPSMFQPDGVNVRYAAEIKKYVKTPVATVGALADPELMEEIIATGKADVVEVARGLIADPDIPIKALFGREDEINQCMRCLYCYAHHMKRANYRCAINPETGNEHELKHDFKPKVLKKVLIAGGGVAGMQAALTCAERGHEVILCEKSGRLGGVLRCEERVPFKARLSRYLDHQAHMLSKTSADIRLSTEVTPELAEKLNPDVIIAAIGARPVIPDFIKGWDRPNVLSAEELYIHPEKAGKRVVIIGGGLVGLELAVFMGMLGREVTVIEKMPVLNDGGNHLQGLALSGEIERYGIRISVATAVAEINDEGVVGVFTGEPLPPKNPMPFSLPQYPPIGTSGTMLFEADTVAYAIGHEPLWNEALALRACAPEFYQIGDCLMPRNIYQAASSAFFTARNLGRKY
jgi:2,4-dienoyl-CoA reductase-like NADH-dependent reductase (Old Yellow Enzyme family)/thioredoxin reductase